MNQNIVNMNQEMLNNYQAVIHELFIRWDALKLAVEHMGGRNGQQVLSLKFVYFFGTLKHVYICGFLKKCDH